MPSPHSAIYSQLLDACEPVPQEEWLANVPAALGARRGTENEEQLLADLRNQFTDELLHEAGVLVPIPSGEDAGSWLHRDLASPMRKWVALLDNEQQPIDLLLSTGSVQHPELALLALKEDKSFCAALREERTLFITFRQQDMILLRSLGLAVAPAIGLDRLSKSTLAEFSTFLPLLIEEESALWAIRIVLLGSSFCDPKPTPPLRFLLCVEHLKKLQTEAMAPLEEVRSWQFSSDFADKLKYYARYNDLSATKEWILHHACYNSYPLVPIPEQTFFEAYQTLREEAGQPNNHTFTQHALIQLQNTIEQVLIAPLSNDVELESNPITANLKFALSELFRELHAHQIAQQLKRMKSPGRVAESGAEWLKENDRLLNMVLKLSKQIDAVEQGKEKPKFAIRLRKTH